MLFPEPVGATDRTSRSASIAATTSAWPGRNSSRPKTSRSTRSALSITPGILTGMPKPDQRSLQPGLTNRGVIRNRSTLRSPHPTADAALSALRKPHRANAGMASRPRVLAPDLFPGGVVERFFRDLARDPGAEDLDLDGRADRCACRHVRVCDGPPDRVAVPAARHAPGHLAADAHRLRAERDRTRVVEHETGKPRLRRRLAFLQQSGAPDELALVELDAEAEPAFIGVRLRANVGAPHPVALLQSQGVDGLVAAGGESLPVPGLPEGVPQPQAELGRAVQLPPELAHVRDAEGEARNGADGEALRRHEWERFVADRARCERLENLPRGGAPESDARVRRS